MTQPNLLLFESNIASFAEDIDVDQLSDSLQTEVTPEAAGSYLSLLWLLAHFIILQKTKKQHVLHSRSLRVLYSLLSTLSTQIRVGFATSDLKASDDALEVEETVEPGLPTYVADKLASLTDRDEISGLLEKFTS